MKVKTLNSKKRVLTPDDFQIYRYICIGKGHSFPLVGRYIYVWKDKCLYKLNIREFVDNHGPLLNDSDWETHFFYDCFVKYIGVKKSNLAKYNFMRIFPKKKYNPNF